MQTEILQCEFLTTTVHYSLDELSRLSHLTSAEIGELVDCGVLVPVDPSASTLLFTDAATRAAQTAARLRTELELDMHAAAVAVHLLDRIRELEAQLHARWVRSPD